MCTYLSLFLKKRFFGKKCYTLFIRQCYLSPLYKCLCLISVLQVMKAVKVGMKEYEMER